MQNTTNPNKKPLTNNGKRNFQQNTEREHTQRERYVPEPLTIGKDVYWVGADIKYAHPMGNRFRDDLRMRVMYTSTDDSSDDVNRNEEMTYIQAQEIADEQGLTLLSKILNDGKIIAEICDVSKKKFQAQKANKKANQNKTKPHTVCIHPYTAVNDLKTKFRIALKDFVDKGSPIILQMQVKKREAHNTVIAQTKFSEAFYLLSSLIEDIMPAGKRLATTPSIDEVIIPQHQRSDKSITFSLVNK